MENGVKKSAVLRFLVQPEDSLSEDCGLLPDVSPSMTAWGCRLKAGVWLLFAVLIAGGLTRCA
ncbi:hypothetical protein N1030_11275 [Desulfovibrio mangrovi]|uniref:hypothetical protein n=1 Tax=Desulfovibrio mangrovi TaxID=2976983 RepID=UPI002246D17F|nr:hypothetical protein [Desulfovibrio mangrovi]UZP66202.1 hypothetical protein N1030_11275 [Desulfovibrio mangrovi]